VWLDGGPTALRCGREPSVALLLDFELRLEERCADRVVVSVLLAPQGAEAVHIDGVALHLERRDGERIGTERVLPISGDLRHAMLSTIELKLENGGLPTGSRVVGIAWNGAEQNEAQLPTDPYTALEAHLRARRRICPHEGNDDACELETLSLPERERLARDHPWINEPRLSQMAAALTVLDHEDTGDPAEEVDGLVDDLGLDADSTEWLKDLLREPSGEE
jgi:hypothetical protein